MNHVRAIATTTVGCFAFAVVGLLDAVWTAELPRTAGAASMRVVLAVLAVYGAAGSIAGLVALAVRSSDALGQRVLAAAPGVFAVCTSWARNGPAHRIVAYACFGVVAYSVLIRLFRRVPELADVATWQRLHALALGVAFVVALSRDPFALTVGIVAVVSAAACVIASLRLRWLAPTASAVLVAAALMLAAWHPPERPDVAETPRGPSVLLVSVDTLRADRVGAYGYRDARTPVMDTLAADGVVFTTAVTHSPYTGPSHLAMLTGRLPTSLDVLINEVPLAKSQRTLADWLRAAGYVTAGFVSGWPLVDEVLEIGHRFHSYGDDLREVTVLPARAFEVGLLRVLDRLWVERTPRRRLPARRAELTARDAVAWLDRNAGRAFFAWVHFYDPHLPYEPPERYLDGTTRAFAGPATGAWYDLDPAMKGAIIRDPASMKHMSDLYDAEIAHADEMLGRVVGAARTAAPAGLFIVVTADHGESFGEHHLFFARDLYDPTMRVPLIVVPPTAPSVKRVDAQVKLSDVAPTILEAVEIRTDDPIEGSSLLPLIHGSTLAATGPAYAFKMAEAREHSQQAYAVRHLGLKLIKRDEGFNDQDHWFPAKSELYDLSLDPAETVDRIVERSDARERLDALLSPKIPPREVLRLDLTPEELRQLRSLGYMD
jgi:arylsulfatase A-like enzyme